MLPSTRSQSPMRALDRMLIIIVLFAIGWFLYARFVLQDGTVPSELQAAEKALKLDNTDMARAQFNRFLNAHPNSPDAYGQVFAECELNHRPDLLLEYAQRGVNDCAQAASPDRARLYLALSQAYAETGKKYAERACAAARQAWAL